MTSVVGLGRLELVPLRQAWPDEAANFTPWLAKEENLALLGEALDLELELEASEKPVGPFAADVLAKDARTGRWVLIENQIEPTDHQHLGQLLTYAAGLEASVIVWIAESFRDEHRAALDFLNRITTEEFAFFGVQIELYRIGDSPFAPRFSLAAKPNNWAKKAQAGKQAAQGEMNEIQLLSREYWTSLIGKARGRYPPLSTRTPSKDNYQYLEQLRGADPNCLMYAVFPWDKSLKLEVQLNYPMAKPAFRKLVAQKLEIEAQFGQKLIWEERPEGKQSRIEFYMPGNEKRENRERWAAQHEWVLDWAPKLANSLRPFVNALDLSGEGEPTEAEEPAESTVPVVLRGLTPAH